MPKFVCSYAYDIPCYADFVVEAKSERAALRKIRRLLKARRFDHTEAQPCWENDPTNQRVFVQSQASEHAPATTLEDLIGSEHSFSRHTHGCIRCRKSAEDDVLNHTPCQS